MHKRFTKLMEKKWEHGLFGGSPTVMGMGLFAIIVGYIWLAFVAGVWIHLQSTCWNVQSECDMYAMQGCDTSYSEVDIATFKIRCTCEVDWCPGQAGIPEDIRLAGGVEQLESHEHRDGVETHVAARLVVTTGAAQFLRHNAARNKLGERAS